jgi:His/Glu/Gln/Arg/opine family amino acid ABC transporter permease subunit
VTVLNNAHYLALIGRSLLMTLFIAGFVIVASNVLALLVSIYMLDPKARLRPLVAAYSFFARAAPVLAILFVLYYGLPRFGIYLDPLPSALIGLSFSSAAYNYEFLRSGFASIPPGQIEAAKALGLRPMQALLKVLIPQAYATAAPSLFSNAIQIVKGSSLASLVAIDELTAASTTIIADTYKAIEVLLTISTIYALIAAVLIGLQYLYERRLRWR